MSSLYLWLDRHDKYMASIGSPDSAGRFTCWGQIHSDAVADFFGEAASDALKSSGGEPVHVLLKEVEVEGYT